MNRLKDYAYNIESQWGEDGIIEEIFKRIGDGNKTCVEFGAYDGPHLSNTWNLWFNKDWKALLIEGNAHRANKLRKYASNHKKVVTLNKYVSAVGEDTIDNIIENSFNTDKSIDLMSIDIDGDDYYVFQSIQKYNPRVVVIEYNPTIPAHLDIIQKNGQYFGASALALTKLAKLKNYKLIEVVGTNCFFINSEEYNKIYDREYTLDELFPTEFTTYLISSYGGYSFLSNKPAYSSPSKNVVEPEYFSSTKLIPIGCINRHNHNNISGWVLNYLRILKNKIKSLVPNKRPATQLYKIDTIIKYANLYNIHNLVETGTYQGTTINAVKHFFSRIFSIELNEKLHNEAKIKFKNYSHIELLQGDSGKKLKDVMTKVNESCLFWLDGHYSGGITSKTNKNTPIIEELKTIFDHKSTHVILIDDARCFNGQDDYPTIKEVENLANKYNYKTTTSNDIIRIIKR